MRVPEIVPGIYISILAPRGGSDADRVGVDKAMGVFQSSLPVGGATAK